MAASAAAKLTLESAVRLPSGAMMPRLGFGVYQARGDECRNAVASALQDGYRHVDSAQAYHNENKVGAAVLASGIPRTSIFLTTKYLPAPSQVWTADEVYEQLVRSPSRLDPGGATSSTPTREPYIDLLLLHAPRPNAAGRAAAWTAMARAQANGITRDIGVSNYGVKHLEALPKDLPRPAVNQIELHPWCQQRDIVAYCRERGIVVQAYCPLARAEPDKMKEPALVAIAKKHGKTGAQVLVRWSLQKGFVPLPKSVTPSRIKENMEVYDFELDKEDMAKLDALDQGAAGSISWNPVDHE